MDSSILVEEITMGFHAFQMGNNVLAYVKNGRKYGMTCAWATMISGDMVIMLIGGQSDTGNTVEVGDVVGISALAKGQENISLALGEHHSSKDDKFSKIDISIVEDTAILIPEAKVQMVAKVVKIEPSFADKDDHLIYFEVLKHAVDKETKFLDLSEVLPE